MNKETRQFFYYGLWLLHSTVVMACVFVSYFRGDMEWYDWCVGIACAIVGVNSIIKLEKVI